MKKTGTCKALPTFHITSASLILSCRYFCECSVGILALQMEKLKPREMIVSHTIMAELGLGS